MPPPMYDGHGNVVVPANYAAVFQAGSIGAYFDILQAGYGETVQVNATIRPIPWSATYGVSVQAAQQSLMPITRSYKAIVWTEADYGWLRAAVGKYGVLTTPREGGPEGAFLNKISRSDMQEQTNPKGAVSVDIEFTMLTTGVIG